MSCGRPSSAVCTYCGLPLPGSWWKARASRDPNEAAYCCLGCRVAASVTQAEGAEGKARWIFARFGMAVFFTMNVMVFTMALWSRDLYLEQGAPAPSELASTLWQLFRYLSLLFSIPVLVLLGGPLFENVWQSIRLATVNTDLLILLGVVAAFVYSAASVFRGDGHVYFEVACMVLLMVTLGRWLEASGKLKTSDALDRLVRLLPDKVRVVRRQETMPVDRKSVQVGERLAIAPGERFAVDGRVVEGQGEVDEQILSGESEAVTKSVGDMVCSGTLNVDGHLIVEVTAAAGHETVSRLIGLVRASRDLKGRYQRAADRLAQWFVPAVCVLAVVVACFHTNASGLANGILAGLAVVLIACPCALGLATPLAVWSAMGQAAREQVIFRSGLALERLAGVRAVRFDKTGTITTGAASVLALEAADPDERAEILRRASSLAAGSTHHFSNAISEFARAEVDARVARHIETIPGRGITGRMHGSADQVWIGNLALMQEAGQTLTGPCAAAVASVREAARSFSCIAWGGRVRGVFVFDEELRPHARAAVAECRQLGLNVAILTGDHRQRADKIAQELDVAVTAEQRPDDKVKQILDARRRYGSVTMIGDGINDAAALAASDVGIAMSCGADITRDAGDVCLLSNDPLRVPRSIELARRTVRVIRQNLFWAFIYNLAGVGLAATGRLNPIWAAAAMALSSLLVVSNSLRLTQPGQRHASTGHGDLIAGPQPTEELVSAYPPRSSDLGVESKEVPAA